MIQSFVSSFSILSFFQPVVDSVFQLPEKDQSILLKDSCLEEGVSFELGTRHEVNSQLFERIKKKIENAGFSCSQSIGGCGHNISKNFAKAGFKVSIGSAIGPNEMFSRISGEYKKFFYENFLDCCIDSPPSQFMCLYDKDTKMTTTFFALEAGREFSDCFLSLLPRSNKYDIIVVEGFLLPSQSIQKIIKNAWKDSVPVALCCSGKEFVERQLDDHLAILPMISLLSVNLEEAYYLTGTDDLVLAAQSLKKKIAPGGVVLVTNQDKDFCVIDGDNFFVSPCIKVKEGTIVNTLGCGDCASSGFFLAKQVLGLNNEETCDIVGYLGTACLFSNNASIPDKTVRRVLEYYPIR